MSARYFAPDFSDKRTTKELYQIIAEAQREIEKELSELMNEGLKS